MSFILDALKKSETDRQQQGTAEFAGVPTSPNRREGMPAWMWVVGVLLIVNLAVLVGIFLRPDVEAPEQTSAAVVPEVETPVEDDFAEQVAAARQNPPRRDDPPPVQAASPQDQIPAVTIASEPIVSSPVTSQPASGSSSNTLALPTIHEVRANGAVMLPDLHVDIHVYSENAQDRFVFINMAKHNEGSRLAEGPLVEEITPEGVVLREGETTFLLPKD